MLLQRKYAGILNIEILDITLCTKYSNSKQVLYNYCASKSLK